MAAPFLPIFFEGGRLQLVDSAWQCLDNSLEFQFDQHRQQLRQGAVQFDRHAVYLPFAPFFQVVDQSLFPVGKVGEA